MQSDLGSKTEFYCNIKTAGIPGGATAAFLIAERPAEHLANNTRQGTLYPSSLCSNNMTSSIQTIFDYIKTLDTVVISTDPIPVACGHNGISV